MTEAELLLKKRGAPMVEFELFVRRSLLTEETTVSDVFFIEPSTPGPVMRACYFLEDRFRALTEPKVPGKTCIPLGRYPLTIEPSPAYQGRPMPRLHNVQGPNGEQRFDGVLIHPGNFERDTRGCQLPGDSFAEDGSPDRMKVTNSVRTFEGVVLPWLKLALSKGAVYVVVELAPPGMLIDKRRLV